MPRSTRIFKKRRLVGQRKYIPVPENKNLIFDMALLNAALNEFATCKKCLKGQLKLTISNCIGLAATLNFECNSCSSKYSFKSSKMNPVFKQIYDVNVRLVYALRCIEKGLEAGQLFCALMNLPPCTQKFRSYTEILLPAVKDIAENTMTSALNECITENENCRDVSVVNDGSWQKRGHQLVERRCDWPQF